MPMAAPLLTPPLRDGDYLTSDEFMRRWEAMPDLKHAELIDGIVYMPSPVSISHAQIHLPLATWLGFYTAKTPGCLAGLDATWRMTSRSIPQPDIALRILPEYGGQSAVDGDYASGAPELIVEIATTSRARDLGVKLKLYETSGVREYIVAVTKSQQLFWKQLTPDGYQPLEADSDGIFRSRCFPGLWLDPAALWSLNPARLLDVLQQGLGTPEHADFAARLTKRKQ